jgi:hypothetical protein
MHAVTRQIVTRFIALARAYQAARQSTFIERSIKSLSASNRVRLESLVQNEMARTGLCSVPAANDAAPVPYQAQWNEAIETGFTRAHSETMEVRLRGIALWLAAVLHETRDVPYANMQPQRRAALRMLRELKEFVPRKTLTEQLMGTNAA